MCAVLAARNDPTEELEFAVDLINRRVDGLEVRTGLDICRGNWSHDGTPCFVEVMLHFSPGLHG